MVMSSSLLSNIGRMVAKSGAKSSSRVLFNNNNAIITSRHSTRRLFSSESSYPYGMHFHVSPVHKHLGTAFGALMWFWIFYRFKEDGKVLIGLEHPWDAHGHGDHESQQSSQEYQYEKSTIGERPSLSE